MARSLTAAMKTALAAEEGYGDVWLLELTAAGGTLRFTSAPEDQAWNSQTWTAIGGDMTFEEASETDDMASQRVGITLSGVDQSIISEILTDDYRGQACILYFGQVQHSTGAVIDDPIAVFTGLLNESWSIKELNPERGPGTVRISTAVVGEISGRGWHAAVRTNLQSHQDMLDRAGLSVTDTFFKTVPDIANKHLKWGGHTVDSTYQPGDQGDRVGGGRGRGGFQ